MIVFTVILSKAAKLPTESAVSYALMVFAFVAPSLSTTSLNIKYSDFSYGIPFIA